jgi:hypothetical protein
MRIQTAWDAIALHTTPGIAAYKPIEVELLYNGVALDSLGIGYETFPADVRDEVVAQYPRTNFKEEVAKAFFDGFSHKPESTVFNLSGAINIVISTIRSSIRRFRILEDQIQ